MAKHYSTKHYGHNIGLSAVFRQPNADHSHCHLLHGYSLAFTFTFGCDELDNKNWAVDFGGLKPLKAWLEDMFDHTFLVSQDDPYRETFQKLDEEGVIQMRVLPNAGMEGTAEFVYEKVNDMIKKKTDGRVWVTQVEVRENEKNSAMYIA